MTDGESDNLIGQVIAERYEVVSSIDAVGNARVYKVKDRQDGVLRALKLISKIQIENVELFQAEADKVKNQIKHPGLVQLCDFGVVRPIEGDPYAYLVSDLISGRSLYNVLNRQGRIELNEALSIITQICQVVKHLHATDVSNLQLSPRKVMLTDQAGKTIARLTDAGLSGRLSTLSLEPAEAGVPFPESVLYLSPEECSGQAVEHRSDIYSLGCMMYECLVGLPPFLSKSAYEVSRMHINEAAKPLRMSRDDLNFPLELDLLVLKSLRKIPSQRQQNMSELLEDLQHVQDELLKVPDSGAPLGSKNKGIIPELFSNFVEDMADLIGVDSSLKVKLAVPIILGLILIFGSISIASMLGSQHLHTADPNAAADKEWQDLAAQAQKDFEKGNASAAENKYLKALTIAEKFGDKDRRLLVTLRNLQDVYFAEKRSDKADEVETRIKSIMTEDSQ